MFQEVEDPRFQDNRHTKVVRLPALRNGRLYTPGYIPGTHFCQRLCRPQGHGATGKIMSMKISNDSIGNRTRQNVPVHAIKTYTGSGGSAPFTLHISVSRW